MLNATEIKQLASKLESHRIERKRAPEGKDDDLRKAICAFANDLPGEGKPGYLLLGIEDDGTIVGCSVTDQVIKNFAAMRKDGRILPLPQLQVYEVEIDPQITVLVVEVFPSNSPPVRFDGRVWIRVGSTKATAGPEDERRLLERSVAGSKTFDQRPCFDSSLGDLDLNRFQLEYLPSAIAADTLAENNRTKDAQLASLRFFDLKRAVPTNGGILVLGVDVLEFIPGAYIHFVRYEGIDQIGRSIDSKMITGNLISSLRQLGDILKIQIRTSQDVPTDIRHEERSDYPLLALREFAFNAVMHRNYEGTSAPVQINWFSDRVEIQNPGGLYGEVTKESFGEVVDYRNPVLSEAMRALGYVEKFGVGIQRAKASLARNNNPPPEFHFAQTHTRVVIRSA